MNSKSPTPSAGASAAAPGTGNQTASTDSACSLPAISWLGPSGESSDTRSALAATTHAGSKCAACCTRRPNEQPSAQDKQTNALSTTNTVATGAGWKRTTASSVVAEAAAAASANVSRTSTMAHSV